MKFCWIFLVSLPCLAQVETLRVFSEFTRIDPFGEIVRQDRGERSPVTFCLQACREMRSLHFESRSHWISRQYTWISAKS